MTRLLILLMALPMTSKAGTVSADAIYVSTIGGQGSQSGIVFSTAVYFVAGASLTLQGPSGYITSSSSINATAFFGDGSHLTGVSTLASSQIFSGANTFASSFTVRSNGLRITLSTSSTVSNIDIDQMGTVKFYPELHNSSSTIIPNATTTNQYCGPCVLGSTLTITTTGGDVEISFSGVLGTGERIAAINFLQDGQFVGDLGADAVIGKMSSNGNSDSEVITVHYLVGAPTSGAHSYCLSLCTNFSSSGFTATLRNDAVNANLFSIKELK